MTGEIQILIVLIVLTLGEGRPLRKINRPYQGKEEPRNCDDCRGIKTPQAANHLLATGVQEELTGKLRQQLEEVLHSSSEVDDFQLDSEYDENILKSEVRLRAHNDNYYIHDDDDSNDINALHDYDNDDDDDNDYDHHDSKISFVVVVVDDDDDDDDGDDDEISDDDFIDDGVDDEVCDDNDGDEDGDDDNDNIDAMLMMINRRDDDDEIANYDDNSDDKPIIFYSQDLKDFN